ncbi:MAG: zf-HC2 domain-containing protein [Nitrospirae bacterium]|uniref:anti-sigma factor family protein n=1 Tax=Candidatus Magnetobacterium casense TaxID=1455061 RepID=UPI0006983BFB|nr:zf-HC2 domain-containing protein [Candidatus Magnetobacterium casensis]MBF0337898.1 zf-HC2 domain-containing protein [Nitrospirota bacterium]
MKHCNETRNSLSKYMDGTLDDASREQVEGHLSQCSTCTQHLQQLQALSHRLSSLGQVKAPDDFHDALRQRMRQPQRHGMTLGIPVTVAALAMVVVIAFSVLHREPRMQRILQEDVRLPSLSSEDKPEGKAKSDANVTREAPRDTLTEPQSQPPAKAMKKAAKEPVVSANVPADKPSAVPPPPALPASLAEAPATPAVAPAMAPSAAAPAPPAKLQASTTPSPPERSKEKNISIAVGSVAQSREVDKKDFEPRQQITLIVSVAEDRVEEAGAPDSFGDSGILKDSAVSKKSGGAALHQEAKQEVSRRDGKTEGTQDFDRVAALIRSRGGRVVSDDAARQRRYMEAEIPAEAYDSLLSELRRIGSVERDNGTGKQETATARDRQQRPDIVLLLIRFQ